MGATATATATATAEVKAIKAITIGTIGVEWFKVERATALTVDKLLSQLGPMVRQSFELAGIQRDEVKAPMPNEVRALKARTLGQLFQDTAIAPKIVEFCAGFGCIGASLGDALEKLSMKKGAPPITTATTWAIIAGADGAAVRSIVEKFGSLCCSLGYRERALGSPKAPKADDSVTTAPTVASIVESASKLTDIQLSELMAELNKLVQSRKPIAA
jgi:hypothetical protein